MTTATTTTVEVEIGTYPCPRCRGLKALPRDTENGNVCFRCGGRGCKPTTLVAKVEIVAPAEPMYRGREWADAEPAQGIDYEIVSCEIRGDASELVASDERLSRLLESALERSA